MSRDRSEYNKKYYNTNKERILEKRNQYYCDNPDILKDVRYKSNLKCSENRNLSSKLYYEKNKERIYEYRKQWAKNNRDKIRISSKRYSDKNADKSAAKESKRRVSKLNRTPSWLTKNEFKEIEQIYKLAKLLTEQTGIKHHVDHIIPLQGKLVSGLHVPSNLQVILAVDNLIKSNSFKETK